MADEDDDIRAALHRDRIAGRPAFDARAAFTTVRPLLVRERRRRMAARSIVAGLVLVAGAGLAVAVRDGSDRSDDALHMSDRNGMPVGPESASSTPGDDGPDRATTTTAIAPTTDPSRFAAASSTSTTAPRAGAPTTTHARDAAGPEPEGGDPGDPDDGVDDDERPTPGDGGTATTSTTSSTTTPAPGPGTTTTSIPLGTTTTSTTLTSTSTTTSTTEAPITGPERFACACGSALVDRSTGVVVVLEVDPAAGYTYRLEDREDNGDQTIQFTGVGEDCELKIPASGAPHPAAD